MSLIKKSVLKDLRATARQRSRGRMSFRRMWIESLEARRVLAGNGPPNVLSITRLGTNPTNQAQVSWRVLFDEAVQNSTVDVTDFSLVRGGALAGGTVLSVSGTGDTYTVQASTGSGDGTLRLDLIDDNSIRDLSGDRLGGPGPSDGNFTSGEVYTFDRTAPLVALVRPVVSGPTAEDQIQFVVSFTEFVSGFDVEDLEVVTTGGVTVVSVSGPSSTTTNIEFPVTIQTSLGDGEVRLRVKDDDSIVDAVGNPLGGAGIGNGTVTSSTGTVIKKSVDIEGTVWRDLNANGFIDAGEAVLPGVTAYLDLFNDGVFDSATEPSQVTDANGRYVFANMLAGNYRVGAVAPTDAQQTFPAAGGPGRLSYKSNTISTSIGPYSAVISSNNQFVILGNGGNLVSYQLNATTGELTGFVSRTTSGSQNDLVLSADHRFLYQVNNDFGTLTVYSVNQTTAALTPQATFTNGISGVLGLSFPKAIELSPDGQQLYATGNGIAQFSRDSVTGALTYLRAVNPTSLSRDIKVSPDNGYLYVAEDAGRLRVYRIDPATKALTVFQTLESNTAGVPAMGSLMSLAVSADGLHIYAASAANHSILHFVRAANGSLSYVDQFKQNIDGLVDLEGVSSLELSPDGRTLYAVGGNRTALVELQRNLTTGKLTVSQSFREASGTPYTTLSEVLDVTVSSDGRFVLVPARLDNAINIFENGLGVPRPYVRPFNLTPGSIAVGNFGFTNLIPVPLAMAPLGPNPTAQSAANFSVQFSEAVTGVDATDFALVTTGSTTASITNVVGSGSNYTITVANIVGSGTLALQLNDNDSIIDSSAQPLNGSGSATAIMTSTPVLVIDQVAPSVASFVASSPTVTRAPLVFFTLNFNETVSGVDASDFAIDAGGSITGASIASVSFSAGTYQIGVNTGSGNGLLRLRLVDNDSIVDTAGTPLGGLGAGNGDSLSSLGYQMENTAESSLSGRLFQDINQNGLRDTDEPPLSNWTVYLDTNRNGQVTPGEPTTTTAADGAYMFTGLFSGQYTLAEVLPAQWEQTLPGAASYPIKRISVTATGAEGNASSDSPSLSADGRYVAFQSSSILVPGDTGVSDIFVYDRITNSLSKITNGPNGALADGGSFFPSISNDGRMVAYWSSATNLVAGDTNAVADVFVYDRQTQTTTLISRGAGGVLGNGSSDSGLDISGDGRFVTFQSNANNLVAGDTNSVSDVFVVDLQNSDFASRIQLLSKSTTGGPANGSSLRPMISDDGSQIVFESSANNMVAADTNGASDIFVVNRVSSVLRRISQAQGGTQANSSSQGAAISGDGRMAAYWSNATNLVSSDTNSLADVFVVDLQTNLVELVSLTNSGQLAGGVGRPMLSTTGRYVGFTSTSSLLTNSGVNDVFLRDRSTSTTRRVSQTLVGSASGGASNFFGLSDDGRWLAFGSDAKHLIPGDTNLARDCFLVDLSTAWMPNAIAVSLGVSQTLSGLNFGNRPTVGEITGSSWQDTSRSGTREANEAGLAGRQIYIDLNNNGAFDAGEPNTLTDSAGNYRLSPAPNGTQLIREVLPANWVATAPNPPVHTRTIGSRNVNLNFEELGTIVATQVLSAYERDVFVLATTSNLASQWRIEVPTGSNTNEILSASTIAGQHLMRKDYRPFSISSLSVRSSASVSVTFQAELQNGTTLTQVASLSAGKSTVTLTNFNNLRSLRWSSPTAIYLDNFALQTSDLDFGAVDFGSMSLPGQIQGSVYHDTNQNGSRDANEPPISGRLIYIDLDNDNVLDTAEPRATSDAQGNFGFVALDAGTYQLRQLLPAGWTQTAPASSLTINLAPNQTVTNANFGSRGAPANIQGTKWNDLNADGKRDPAEPGLAGWTVYLDLNNNGALDPGEPSTVTATDNGATTDVDETGTYEFLDLPPVNYVVRDLSQAGWLTTSPLAMVAGLQNAIATGWTTPTFQHHPDYDHFISGNGRYEVFTTNLALLPQDLNSHFDVYVFDRQLSTYELISIGLSGTAPSAHSLEPSISDDGRYVAFRSFGTTLTTASVNANMVNIYVRDRQTQTTQLITTGTTAAANNYSYEPVISGDGQTVVFMSWASNLVSDDLDTFPDLFIKDLVSGQLTRVEASAIVPTMSIAETWGGDISTGGRYVTFQAVSQGISHIFWMDRVTNQLRLVSTNAAGTPGNGQSEKCAISGDGRFVAFDSTSTNLTDDWGVTGYNVFLKDMVTGEIRLISRSVLGGAAGGSRRPDLSYDGRWITFESTSQTMFADSSNSPSQIVMYDRLTGSLKRLTDNAGTKGNAPSVNASISTDGRTIIFASTATNLGVSGTGLFTLTQDYSTSQPQAITVGLTAGITTGRADFGATQAIGTLAGVEFDDVNRNGQRDAGEAAIAGAIVYVDLNRNSVRDAGEPTSTTGSDGAYSFTNLLAGSYQVRAEVPPGRVPTGPVSSRNRLFGIYGTTSVTIAELVPATGATISLTNINLSGSTLSGAAFDGTNVLLLSGAYQSLMKVLPSGDYERIPLAYSFLPGLAYQNGLAYFIATINSWPHLVAFDVNLRQAQRILPITHSLDGYGSDPLPNFGGGLGEAPDGNGLIITAADATTPDVRLMRLDTSTGRITQYVCSRIGHRPRRDQRGRRTVCIRGWLDTCP